MNGPIIYFILFSKAAGYDGEEICLNKEPKNIMRGGRSIPRISINESNDVNLRISRPEEAVRDLVPRTSVVCSIITDGRTFTGKASSRLEAESVAIQNCFKRLSNCERLERDLEFIQLF